MAAAAVGADQHLPPLAVDDEHILAAGGAFALAHVGGLVVALIGLDSLHHLPGALADALDKFLSAPPPPGDIGQFLFPFGRQFRGAQGRRSQGDHLDALGGGHQFLPMTLDIKGVQKLLDYLRPGSRGAQTAPLHGFTQFFILDKLTRVLHGGQKGGLGIAGGRFGPGFIRLAALKLLLAAFDLIAQNLLRQLFLGALLFLRHGTGDCLPAAVLDHLAAGVKTLPGHLGDQGGLVIAIRRV